MYLLFVYIIIAWIRKLELVLYTADMSELICFNNSMNHAGPIKENIEN